MAEHELEAILADARRGQLSDPADRSTKTFGEACDEWLRYVKQERRRAPSTVRDYENVVRSRLEPEFGRDASLAGLSTERLDDYRAGLLADGELSPRTVQKVMVILFGILKRAKRRRWIPHNPAEDAERVQLKRSGDFNVLTPVEVEALARAAESDQEAAIFTVAAFTGLRMGELRALR